MMRQAWLVVILLLEITVNAQPREQGRLRIAAASDLKFALDSVVAVFVKNRSHKIEVIYGSSGKLSEQIANGAPFDIFFSADIQYPRLLQEKGLVSSDIYSYGVGRLVLWSKKIDPRKEGMKSLLLHSIHKIAIANPLHAPYGKRAEESLKYYELFDQVREKLVYGENISQASQFAATGVAEVGIIAFSLALSPNMKMERGRYFIVPQEAHAKLEQGAVITSHGKENRLATSFMDFVKGDEANRILAYFGFVKP